MKSFALIIIIFALLQSNAIAATVFETNFDNIPDWQSTETQSTTEDWASTYNKLPAVIPAPFTSYRASVTPPTSGITKQQHYISSDIAYSGKAYQAWYYNNTSYWQHGCISKHLGNTGYSELYIQFKVKYDDNWKWRPHTENTLTGGSPQAIFQKLFRIIYNVDLDNLHGDPQNTNDYDRYLIADWWGWGDGYPTYPRLMLTARNDDDWSDADDVTTYTDALWYDIFSDLTQWYTLTFHIKMNDYPSNNGVFEFWVNNTLITSHSDIRYIDEAALAGAKMSFIMFADNIFNSWASGPVEQSMAIDDLVVSSTPIDGSNITCYPDVDGDYYPGTGSESVTTCSTNYYEASHFTSMTIDCDDTDPLSYPGAGSCVSSVATPLRTGAQITRTGTTPIRTQ